MSIQSEIARIQANVEAAYKAVEERGGFLPKVKNAANLAGAIMTIPEGDELPSVRVDDEQTLTAALAGDAPAVKLTENITLPSRVTVKSDKTIYLNGQTLSGDSAAVGVAVSGADTHLTISGPGTVDTAIQASGGATLTIEGDVEVSSSYAASVVGSGATININGGTISNESKVAVQAQSGTNVTISGGEVEANDYAVKALSGSTVEITGGVVSGKNGAVYVSDTKHNGTGRLNISGGEVKSEQVGITMWDDTELNISGGTVEATACIMTNGSAVPSNNDVVINVTGGTLTGSLVAVYLPAGKMNISENANMTGAAGIVVRGGVLKISGGEITATSGDTVNVGDAKYPVPAAAVSIDANDNYQGGTVDVTISGGTIRGASATDRAVVYTMKGEVQDYEIPAGIKLEGATYVGTIPTHDPKPAVLVTLSDTGVTSSVEKTGEKEYTVTVSGAVKAETNSLTSGEFMMAPTGAVKVVVGGFPEVDEGGTYWCHNVNESFDLVDGNFTDGDQIVWDIDEMVHYQEEYPKSGAVLKAGFTTFLAKEKGDCTYYVYDKECTYPTLPNKTPFLVIKVKNQLTYPEWEGEVPKRSTHTGPDVDTDKPDFEI